IRKPPGNRCGNRRSAEADGREMTHMFWGAIGMVEHAGDEIRRSAADRKPLALNEVEHLSRIPDIAQVDGRAFQYRNQKRAEHADEVADGGAGELAATVVRIVLQQLARLKTQRLMAVHNAFRVARRTRGERDQRWAGGVGRQRAGMWLRGEQLVVGLPDEPHDRDVLAEVGLKLHAAELFRRDEHTRLGPTEDWGELLAS